MGSEATLNQGGTAELQMPGCAPRQPCPCAHALQEAEAAQSQQNLMDAPVLGVLVLLLHLACTSAA